MMLFSIIRWRRPSGLRPFSLLANRYASTRLTRREKIDNQNHLSRSKLFQLDTRFNLFNKKVSRVVDLGYAPGNWMTYARDALLATHDCEPEKIYQRCTIVGLDIVVANAPRGTFATQGNVLSKLAQRNVLEILKEHAYRNLAIKSGVLNEKIGNDESKELTLEAGIEQTRALFENLSLSKDETLESILSLQDYQAHLVMSDLTTPFLQNRGFFNNTFSRPFIRSSTNTALRMNLTDPEKNCIDLADAALLFCCENLAKAGSLVIRLAKVDLADPELSLLRQRLENLFTSVQKWSIENKTESDIPKVQELFFVCEDKRDQIADKYVIFDVKRPS